MQRCKQLKFLKVWFGIGFIGMAMVVYLSTTSSPPDTSGIQFGDKIFHMLGYFCLFYWFGQIYRKDYYWQPASGLIVMGVALEFVQYNLGYRHLEFADMVANTSGVFLGWFVTRFVYADWLEMIEKKIRR